MNRYAIAASCSVAIASHLQAAVITSFYEGPSPGDWSNAGNWDPAGVPNNGVNTYLVVIVTPGAHSIFLDQNVAIDQLTIDADDTLHMLNSFNLVLAGAGTVLDNFGTINMISAGAATDFVITADSAISGTGELRMLNHLGNRIYGSGAVRRLTNGASHEFFGGGSVGVNSNLLLTNHGVIGASEPVGITLDLVGVASDNLNTGELRAEDGSTLRILHPGFDNTNGLVEARDGSVVELNDCTIIGGNLTTQGSGAIRPVGTATLSNVDSNALIDMGDTPNLLLVAPFTNAGIIQMNSIGGATDLILGSDVTFNGGGDIVMSNSLNNRIYGTGAVRRLVNPVDHLIHGAGQIGINSNLLLTNEGLIDANQPQGITLDLIGTTSDNVNTGVLQASPASELRILDPGLDNTGGLIQALDGALIELNGPTLIGGEIHTEGSGVVNIVGSTTLNAVTNTGNINVGNTPNLILIAPFVNEGVVQLNSAGGATDIILASDIALDGGGEIVMSNHINNRIYGSGGPRRLTNPADHLIHGAGSIGLNSNLVLTNEGLIEATQSAGITFDLIGSAADNFNSGTLRAGPRSELRLVSTGLDNTNGLIAALDTASIELNDTTVIGGEIHTEGSAAVQIVGTATLNGIHSTALIDMGNGPNVTLVNSFTNDGEYQMNSAGAATDLILTSDVSLGGNGEFVMSNNANNRFYGSGAVRRLTNEADHTIRGAASMGVNVNFNLTNHGTIIADQVLPITIDVTNDLTNDGLLQASGAGGITIVPGAFNNSGDVIVDAGSKLTRSANYNQTGGQSLVNGLLNVTAGGFTQSGGVTHVTSTGTMTITGPSFSLQGGTLMGKGLTTTLLNNTGGDVAPGSSAGTMTVTGAYTQSAGGSLEIELGGAVAGQFDVLATTGAATLNGALNVSYIDGFVPTIGSEFVILTAPTVSGQFSSVGGPAKFDVLYARQSVTLVVLSLPCGPGDINCDGIVDVDDLLEVINAWGKCAAPCPADIEPPGPPQGNGIVDVDDLLVVINNWS